MSIPSSVPTRMSLPFIHVFITTPHEKSDPSVTIRHCDRLSGVVALRTVDNIRQFADTTTRNLRCTYVRGSVYRALLDLNRPIARMSTWRRELDNLIQQAIAKGEHVILIDIHSYNSDKDIQSPHLPPLVSLNTAYMLIPSTADADEYQSNIMHNLYNYLRHFLGRDAIGLAPCAEMNDIVTTIAAIPGVLGAGMICVNESLTHDQVDSLSQTITLWLKQLCDHTK